MSMLRANSAWKMAGPRHGTTSIRTFGAACAIFCMKRRHQEFDREIRHHQAELPVASGCVECIGLEQAADLIEHLGERPAQRLRARRQLHAGAGPHQQGIAEQVAQSLQRVARSRLRQPDPHRGAADIGFPQQGVERHQQVEVERFQIHRREYISYHLSIGRMAFAAR